MRRLLCLLLAACAAYSQPHPETKAFADRLSGDVRAGAARWNANFETWKQGAAGRNAEGYLLAAQVNLHRASGDAALLETARTQLVWMARNQKLIHAFHVSSYIECFDYLNRRGALSAPERAAVAALIRRTLRDQTDFPDWGAHNRSIVFAGGYYHALRALPGDADAPLWRAYAEAMMSESWGRWSVEDASMYQSFWFFLMLDAAEAAGRLDELMRLATTRFYFDYHARQMMPNGLMPDFGDSEYYGLQEWYVATMVKGAAHYRNGQYLDHARRFYATQQPGSNVYVAAAALKWLDTSLAPEPLKLEHSEEVLEDLVGKKIIFRGGGSADASYLLLNYRDEGPYGRYTRDHLDQVLAAYEEKPHHGHADENAVLQLMEGQTLLLGDGGYRPLDDFFGGWRADVFHNRVVARQGWPMRGDLFDYLLQDKLYRAVRTEKLHFASFGPLDYSRTRLADDELGYTGDRIILFLKPRGIYIVVDSIHINRGGHRTFANVWHPERVLNQGEGWVVSHPDKIRYRTLTHQNLHTRELLIQFLERRDKPAAVKTIRRRWEDSQAFYESVTNRFFDGQWLRFITVLQPHAPGSFAPAMLDAVRILPGGEDARTLGLEVSVDGRPLTIGLKLDRSIGLTALRGRPLWEWQTGRVAYGRLATDADFAFVWDTPGAPEYGLMYASRLDWGGATLWELPVSPKIYQGPATGYPTTSREKMPYWRWPQPQN